MYTKVRLSVSLCINLTESCFLSIIVRKRNDFDICNYIYLELFLYNLLSRDGRKNCVSK